MAAGLEHRDANQAGPDDKPRLSKDIENHILEACELDVELYKQAVEVFSSRASELGK